MNPITHPIRFYEIAPRAGLDQQMGRIWPPRRMLNTPVLEARVWSLRLSVAPRWCRVAVVVPPAPRCWTGRRASGRTPRPPPPPPRPRPRAPAWRSASAAPAPPASPGSRRTAGGCRGCRSPRGRTQTPRWAARWTAAARACGRTDETHGGGGVKEMHRGGHRGSSRVVGGHRWRKSLLLTDPYNLLLRCVTLKHIFSFNCTFFCIAYLFFYIYICIYIVSIFLYFGNF